MLNTVLDYNLWALERALVWQIVSQDKDVEAFLKSSKFKSKNGFVFKIVADPQILIKDDINVIFLRGFNSDQDYKICTLTFSNNEDLYMVIREIKAAIKELCIAVLEWKKTQGKIKKDKAYYNDATPNLESYLIPDNWSEPSKAFYEVDIMYFNL